MEKKKIKAQPFDCMQYFYSAAQKPRIRCLILFKGRVREAALKRAVDLSINAVPLIGCVFDEKCRCWRKRGFTAKDIVRVINTPEDDESAESRYLLTGIDHTCEPQVKILLVREKTRDVLCAVVNHMVCDGSGFKEYLYLLGKLYTLCEKDTDFDKKPEPFGRRNLNQLLQNLSLREKLKILFSKSDFNKPDPHMIMPIKGYPANPMIVITRFEEAQLEAIHLYAKIRHASINDMLLAAYLRALRRATGCGEITVPCPVDLRRFRKADQHFGICNLTGNYICSAKISPDETFDDTLIKVSHQMQVQKTGDACLKGPMLYHMIFHILPFKTVQKLFYKISPVPVTSYTNLGVLDDAKLCFGDCAIEEAFISTAIKKAPYFQLSASTFQGRCTLTSSFYGTEGDKNTIHEILNGIKSEMESLNCQSF